MGVQSSGLLYT